MDKDNAANLLAKAIIESPAPTNQVPPITLDYTQSRPQLRTPVHWLIKEVEAGNRGFGAIRWAVANAPGELDGESWKYQCWQCHDSLFLACMRVEIVAGEIFQSAPASSAGYCQKIISHGFDGKSVHRLLIRSLRALNDLEAESDAIARFLEKLNSSGHKYAETTRWENRQVRLQKLIRAADHSGRTP